MVSGGLELYPAALGVLVASKAYGVVRSAVVPRLLPPRISLVKANSRVTLGGLLATGVAAPIAGGLQAIGARWPLYGAFVIFIAGMFLSFRLPHKVDSAKGEDTALLAADERHLHGPHRQPVKRPGLRTVGPAVTHALAANASIRCLTGFSDLLPGVSAAGASDHGAERGGVAGHGGGRGGRGERAGYVGGGRGCGRAPRRSSS
ncbi:hypothetical protein GCM10020256_43020 [Streptomyces thermocoprophilus]